MQVLVVVRNSSLIIQDLHNLYKKKQNRDTRGSFNFILMLISSPFDHVVVEVREEKTQKEEKKTKMK